MAAAARSSLSIHPALSILSSLSPLSSLPSLPFPPCLPSPPFSSLPSSPPFRPSPLFPSLLSPLRCPRLQFGPCPPGVALTKRLRRALPAGLGASPHPNRTRTPNPKPPKSYTLQPPNPAPHTPLISRTLQSCAPIPHIPPTLRSPAPPSFAPCSAPGWDRAARWLRAPWESRPGRTEGLRSAKLMGIVRHTGERGAMESWTGTPLPCPGKSVGTDLAQLQARLRPAWTRLGQFAAPREGLRPGSSEGP